MTREPDLFKMIYQKYVPVQSNKDWVVFSVPIVISKDPSQVELNLDAPTLVYQQHDRKI